MNLLHRTPSVLVGRYDKPRPCHIALLKPALESGDLFKKLGMHLLSSINCRFAMGQLTCFANEGHVCAAIADLAKDNDATFKLRNSGPSTLVLKERRAGWHNYERGM